MIEFIEKEPWYNDDLFTGVCYMYPNYMLKDGKELFMFNRRDPDDEWVLEKNEERKKQLLSNNGAYCRFNGFHESPMEMIKAIAKRKAHFVEPENLFRGSMKKSGYEDFHGNLREVSAAFHYRIYDFDINEKVRNAVRFLKQEQWENAILAVEEVEK